MGCINCLVDAQNTPQECITCINGLTNDKGVCKFENCDIWFDREKDMLLDTPKCVKCHEGFSEWENECVKCDNYFDNYSFCRTCAIEDGHPADCTSCIGDRVLLEAEEDSYPAHQCGYIQIDNCDV